MIIAVDGESSSGKGTVSRLLANKLNFAYLDTGLIYRAVAYLAMQKNLLDNIDAMVDLAQNLKPEDFLHKELKNDSVASVTSSVIASKIEIRQALLEYQRNFGNNPRGVNGEKLQGAVLDGRDIGTVIFPNANLKFYITAQLQTRAERRFAELKETSLGISLTDIYESLKQRDINDKTRSYGALKKAEDAIEVDTTNLSVPEVLATLLKVVNNYLEKINNKARY